MISQHLQSLSPSLHWMVASAAGATASWLSQGHLTLQIIATGFAAFAAAMTGVLAFVNIKKSRAQRELARIEQTKVRAEIQRIRDEDV